MTLNRPMPLPMVLEGGPLDGLIYHLWPESVGDDLTLPEHDRWQHEPCWFHVYRRSGPDRYVYVETREMW